MLYIARALCPGSGMTPGKVSEGAVGEMESDRTSCENDTDCFNSTQRQPHTVAKKIYIVNTKCSYTLAPRLDCRILLLFNPEAARSFPGRWQCRAEDTVSLVGYKDVQYILVSLATVQ